MAGKNTFKDGKHISRKATMVEMWELSEAEWTELEAIADYKFDNHQRYEINHKLSMIRAGKNWADTNVTSQDTKRTLKRISTLNPTEALEAVKNCDAITMAYLDQATWTELNLRKLVDNVTGEQVAEAAKIALNIMPENKGGRPHSSQLLALAKLCCEVWLMTKNPEQKAYVNADYEKTTPIVNFSAILFRNLKNVDHDKSDIAKLLNLYIGKVYSFL